MLLKFVALITYNVRWVFNFQVASNVENMVQNGECGNFCIQMYSFPFMQHKTREIVYRLGVGVFSRVGTWISFQDGPESVFSKLCEMNWQQICTGVKFICWWMWAPIHDNSFSPFQRTTLFNRNVQSRLLISLGWMRQFRKHVVWDYVFYIVYAKCCGMFTV